MSNYNKPIGILGGTFDPIHYGHLRMAIELLQAVGLDKVHLIPCFQPVHRHNPIATAQQRIMMLRASIAQEASLEVDDIEIKREGPSYTIDTLIALRQRLPQTPLCLMMGIDALLNFTSWHRWEEILQLAHLVVAHRPQYDIPQEGQIADLLQQRLKKDPQAIRETLAGNILLSPISQLEISATDIRQQFANNKNPRYLLPNSVFDYINQHNLYR